MEKIVAVKVVEGESADLDALLKELEESQEIILVEPFDGVVFAQAFISVTPAALPVLLRWIRSRAEARKSYKVAVNGVELSGYTPREIARVCESLQRLTEK